MMLQETSTIDGQSWAIAEIPLSRSRAVTETGGRAEPPLVVTQHMEADRRFVIINSQVNMQTHKKTSRINPAVPTDYTLCSKHWKKVESNGNMIMIVSDCNQNRSCGDRFAHQG